MTAETNRTVFSRALDLYEDRVQVSTGFKVDRHILMLIEHVPVIMCT